MAPDAAKIMEQATKARRIQVLPQLVVDQIAAGEVVERPASVVKELIDNAIDAGARRIVVELERGGIELIRIRDDGGGIGEDQLSLAVHAHATSKISHAEDLDCVGTMGFRGEALASIASVSRLTIESRTAGSAAGYAIDVDGGRMSTVRPTAGAVGTCVTVRTLFYNTPARRKFLRTDSTERGHCVDVVRNLAMGHPAIGFAVHADGKVVFDVPTGQGPRERAFEIVGREMEGQYLEVSADAFDDARGVTLWGLLGTPALATVGLRKQHVFLNGRPIRDRTIQHAIKEAYRGLIEPSRQPAAVLMLEMDPRAFDVNVHPAKAEVRFRDSGVVHSVVYNAARRVLLEQEAMPSASDAGRAWRFEATTPMEASGAPAASPSQFAEYFKRQAPGSDAALEYAKPTAPVPQELRGNHLRPSNQPDVEGQGAMPAPSPVRSTLQVHNSYLVTQDERGLVIIDQHALHERIMFEKLTARITDKGSLESQPLLVPASFEADQARLDAAEKLQPLLAKLGIELEPMGPRTLAVRAFPTILFERGVEAQPFMQELLDKAASEGLPDSPEAALSEVLDMMACKAAIKAGDAMSQDDVSALLDERERVERSGRCPHGRPTAIRLTVEELARQFGR
ncbi:MAG: DNA mismatch repair endonuclease MutL [Phycisphaerales bacterium]|nr:DNA mismatch repair endonuclease MutL [Phycisphaerales bacterium]